MAKEKQIEGPERVAEILKNHATEIVEKNAMQAIKDIDEMAMDENAPDKLVIFTTQILEKVGTCYNVDTKIKFQKVSTREGKLPTESHDPTNPDLPMDMNEKKE